MQTEIQKELELMGVHLSLANEKYAKVIRLMTPAEKKSKGLSNKHVADALAKRKINRFKSK